MNISDLRSRFELAKIQADAAVNMGGQEGIRRMEEARSALQTILRDVSKRMQEIDTDFKGRMISYWDIPERCELEEKKRVLSNMVAKQKITDEAINAKKKKENNILSVTGYCFIAIIFAFKLGVIGAIIMVILQAVFFITGLFSGNFDALDWVSNVFGEIIVNVPGLFIVVAIVVAIAALIGAVAYGLFSKPYKGNQTSRIKNTEHEIAALQATISAKEQERQNHNKHLEQEKQSILSEWHILHSEISNVLDRISCRIENENQILAQAAFDEDVRSYKNTALNNSEALSSLVRYMAELYERSMGVYRLQAYEKELRCLFSFTVQKDRIVFDRPRNKQQSEQDDTYYFKNQRKKELQSIQEQYGLAWALSVLLENEMRMRYPQGTIEIIQRKEADVMMVFSIKNPEYKDEQPLF